MAGKRVQFFQVQNSLEETSLRATQVGAVTRSIRVTLGLETDFMGEDELTRWCKSQLEAAGIDEFGQRLQLKNGTGNKLNHYNSLEENKILLQKVFNTSCVPMPGPFSEITKMPFDKVRVLFAKYGLSPRDCPRAQPEGNPKGSALIVPYLLT